MALLDQGHRPVATSIGDFIFRHRDWLFPVLVLGLFACATPTDKSLPEAGLARAVDFLAVLICVAGVLVRCLVIGFEHVRRAGSDRRIHADALKTGGMFRLCRNPLYVGNVLIASGIFLKHGNPFVAVAGIGLYVAIYRSIVAAEERYLVGRFGSAYADYCADVPRWVPRLSRWREARDGSVFNFRRVLLVEYTNIGLTLSVLLMEEIYETYSHAPSDRNGLEVLTGALVLVLAWILTVRFIKKRRIIVADTPTATDGVVSLAAEPEP